MLPGGDKEENPMEEKALPVEPMAAFFTARAEGYDQHMLEEVEGCREGYEAMAQAAPEGVGRLLDLGCGTGLELGPLFRRFPEMAVTGIDLTRAMLEKLREKYPGKALTLLEGDYLSMDLGQGQYDLAVSFQTMHHFSPEEKRELYRRIARALTPGGQYLECDYVAASPEEEARLFAENRRLRQEQGIPQTALYHVDTPCTVETQLRLFREAGFAQADFLWKMGNTALLAAKKIPEGSR